MSGVAQSRKRVDWADYAKGIGIFLVVLGHVLRGLSDDGLLGNANWVGVADNWIYAFHMPLFFFLSGLFASRSIDNSPSTFLAKRLRSIAYPYAVWILITGTIRTAVYSGADSTLEFLKSYWQIVYEPYDIYWFLYALFVIGVVYYLLRRLGLSTVAAAVVFLAAYLAVSLGGITVPWRPGHYLFLYGIYFAAGTLFTELRVSTTLESLSGIVKILVGVLCVGLVWYLAFNELLVAGTPVLYAAAAGIAAVILLSQYFERIATADFVRRWGTLSLQIYVAHTIVGAAVRLALVQAGVDSPALHILAGVLLGIYVPIAIFHAGNRVGFPWLFEVKKARPRASPVHP